MGTVNSSARIFMQKGLKGILQTSLPNYPTGCIPTHCPVFFVALSGSETDPDGPATNVENDETYPSTKKTFWWSQNSQCTSKNRSVIILSTTEHLVVIHDWHTHTQTDTHTHRHTHTHTHQEEFRVLALGKHHAYGSSFPNLSSICQSSQQKERICMQKLNFKHAYKRSLWSSFLTQSRQCKAVSHVLHNSLGRGMALLLLDERVEPKQDQGREKTANARRHEAKASRTRPNLTETKRE